jgi:hypothetical protein
MTFRCVGVQIDDAYLDEGRSVGKLGRGSENKVPIDAEVALNDAGHPLHVKLGRFLLLCRICRLESSGSDPRL